MTSTTAREEALSFLDSIQKYEDSNNPPATVGKGEDSKASPEDVLNFLDNVAKETDFPLSNSSAAASSTDALDPGNLDAKLNNSVETKTVEEKGQGNNSWGSAWGGLWSDATKVVQSAKAFQQGLESKAVNLVKTSENSVKTFLKNKNIEKLGDDLSFVAINVSEY
jgi:hypothetical protein